MSAISMNAVGKRFGKTEVDGEFSLKDGTASVEDL